MSFSELRVQINTKYCPVYMTVRIGLCFSSMKEDTGIKKKKIFVAWLVFSSAAFSA